MATTCYFLDMIDDSRWPGPGNEEKIFNKMQTKLAKFKQPSMAEWARINM